MSISVFYPVDGRSGWQSGGIAVHKNRAGSADSGLVATPIVSLARTALSWSISASRVDLRLPCSQTVTTHQCQICRNGPRGIGIARASQPLSPFQRFLLAAPALRWPKNAIWKYGSHMSGILDDSQAHEPMSAGIYVNDMFVLTTDGGACQKKNRLGIVAFTEPATAFSASPHKLFAFGPTLAQVLEECTAFPDTTKNYTLRVMPKNGPPQLGVGSLINGSTATFCFFQCQSQQRRRQRRCGTERIGQANT